VNLVGNRGELVKYSTFDVVLFEVAHLPSGQFASFLMRRHA
jgi:hypothetical protein